MMNILNILISIFAIITLIGALCITFDSKGDKSNGWAWKCAIWIAILLMKMWS